MNNSTTRTFFFFFARAFLCTSFSFARPVSFVASINWQAIPNGRQSYYQVTFHAGRSVYYHSIDETQLDGASVRLGNSSFSRGSMVSLKGEAYPTRSNEFALTRIDFVESYSYQNRDIGYAFCVINQGGSDRPNIELTTKRGRLTAAAWAPYGMEGSTGMQYPDVERNDSDPTSVNFHGEHQESSMDLRIPTGGTNLSGVRGHLSIRSKGARAPAFGTWPYLGENMPVTCTLALLTGDSSM